MGIISARKCIGNQVVTSQDLEDTHIEIMYQHAINFHMEKAIVVIQCLQ